MGRLCPVCPVLRAGAGAGGMATFHTLAVWLAVVLVAHSCEATVSADAEGVGLGESELQTSQSQGDAVAEKLKAIGKVVKGLSDDKDKIHTALSRGFSAKLWDSWDGQAAAQKLDASASVSILTSYLCANVNDGSKVMHVISWVKQALRRHNAARAMTRQELGVKVTHLQQNVADTHQLLKQQPSAATKKLVQQTEGDLAEAQGELAVKDSKLKKLKQAAAAKKKKAEKLTKQLAAQKKAKKSKAKKAGKKGKKGGKKQAKKGAKTLTKLLKKKKKAVKKKKAKKMVKKLGSHVKHKKLTAKKVKKTMKVDYAKLKAKAAKLHQEVAKTEEKMHMAAAEATVAEKKASTAKGKNLLKFIRKAAVTKREHLTIKKQVKKMRVAAEKADKAAKRPTKTYIQMVEMKTKENKKKSD